MFWSSLKGLAAAAMSALKAKLPGTTDRNWSAYNAAKINERRLFPIILFELCLCLEELTQDRGRPRLSLRDMIFCAVLRVFTKSPLRQFTQDAFLAYSSRLIKKVPHFNSVSNYLRMKLVGEKLMKLISISSLPLKAIETNFAVDSTGLSTCRYARWLDLRQMRERAKRQWVKVHLICGVRTNIVTSVIVTSGSEADGPRFGPLLAETARNFRTEEIYADKAYLSGENFRFALLAGAAPYIPFKSNNRLDADYKSTFWKRMLRMYLERRPEFLAHYNLRNNVETTFSMVKANFGARLASVSRQAQFNEALCKILCHNICVLIRSIYELGIEVDFCSESSYDLTGETKPLGQALSGDQLSKVRARIPALLKKAAGKFFK
jgi:transposase